MYMYWEDGYFSRYNTKEIGMASARIFYRDIIYSDSWFMHAFWNYLSLIMRKPVFGISHQVRHKLVCAATEAS